MTDVATVARGLSEALNDLEARLADIGGCSDGYCVVERPKGMHTNGGCRCGTNRMTAERALRAYLAFAQEVRAHLLSGEAS